MRPIIVVEPAANEGGKKRSSPPAQEILAEKKPKTSFATLEGSPATSRFVIDLTSSKGEKDRATRSEPVTPAMPKMASSITNMITQRRGSVVPPVPKLVPRRPLEAKSGSHLERLAIMKSDKVNYAAKVALRPTLLALRLIRQLGRRRLGLTIPNMTR
ncbi:hypothetical protein ACFX2J_045434 [Malus domestica]